MQSPLVFPPWVSGGQRVSTNICFLAAIRRIFKLMTPSTSSNSFEALNVITVSKKLKILIPSLNLFIVQQFKQF